MEPGTTAPFYSMGRGYSDIFAGDIIDNQENDSTIDHADTITTAFSSSQNNEGIFLNDRMFDPPSKICGGPILQRNGSIYNNDQMFDPPSKICGGSVLSKIMSLSNRNGNGNKKKKEKEKKKKDYIPSVAKVIIPSKSPPSSTAINRQLNINTSNSTNAISCDDSPLSPTNDIILADLKIGIIEPEGSRQFGDYNVKRTGEEKNVEKTIVKSRIQSRRILYDDTGSIVSISSTTGDNVGSERPSYSGVSSLEEMQTLLKDLKALNSKVKKDTKSKLGKTSSSAMTVFDKDSSKTSVMDYDRKEILDNSAPNKTDIKPSLKVNSRDTDEERKSRYLNIQEENSTVHYPPKKAYHDDVKEVSDQVIRKLKLERKQYRREADTLRQEMDTIKKELDQIRMLVLPKTDILEKKTTGNEDNRLQLLNELVQDDELEQTLVERDESLNHVSSGQFEIKATEESASGEAGQYDIVNCKYHNDHMIHNKHKNLFCSTDTAENNRDLHHQSNENLTNLEQPIPTTEQSIILNPNNDADPMDDNISSVNNNLALTIVSSKNQYHGYNLNSDYPSAISDPPDIIPWDIESQTDPPPAKAGQGSTHSDGPVDVMEECHQYWQSKRDAAVNSNSSSHSKIDALAQVHTNMKKCDNENVGNNLYKNPEDMLKACRQYWQNRKDDVPSRCSSTPPSPIDASTLDSITTEKCDNGNSVNDDEDYGNNMLEESRQNRHSKHNADNEASPRNYSRSTNIDDNIDDNIINVSKGCKKDKVLRSRSSSPFKKFLYTQEHKEDNKVNSSNSSHSTNITTAQEVIGKEKCDIKNAVNADDNIRNVSKGCKKDKVLRSRSSSPFKKFLEEKSDIKNAVNADDNIINVSNECKKDKVLRSRSSSPFRKFLYAQEHREDTKAGPSKSSRSTNIASTEEIGIKEKKSDIKNAVNAYENIGKYDAMMETFDFDSAASFYRQYNQPCLLEQRGVFSSVSSRNSPRLTMENVDTSSADSITQAHRCDLKDTEDFNHEGKKENSDINSSSTGRGSSTKNADQLVRKCEIEKAGNYVRELRRTLHLKETKDEHRAVSSTISPTEDDEGSVKSRLQESASEKYSRLDDPHPLAYNPCSRDRRTVAAMKQEGDDSAEDVANDDANDDANDIDIDIEIFGTNYGKPPLAPIMGYLPPPSSPSPPPLMVSSSYYL
ncbi:hypothetical protein FRACYDRAFT_233285 [Fragilariopsis cylindrus CCMP1102]|uniref:Uncharacterized protein n=1 Tax=Fragilariopsis cylindrus CCMP1102 TaxID=635003 RepID=A0A1E7FY95_9STRA|nr:hypothetical protein FRACYDRAFT_233285 [Fragilariopsis cylindrus CCMP1102]|eukprot:OEU23118.1 hypothetical protein FRACYDRAFT_233285 [Fragilariopsis cylindrus CCMP1102]